MRSTSWLVISLLLLPGCGPPPGALGTQCYDDGDCTSGLCGACNACPGVFGHSLPCNCTCVAPTCTDGRRNQDETGFDCGGSICGPCPESQLCARDRDCAAGLACWPDPYVPACHAVLPDGGPVDGG